ncbi:MAG: hypothetical protein VX705_03970, partial [Verrucomicrobiota bacterium]|nr:hypothetical protein [Verrucomicrobiota bacterium]
MTAILQSKPNAPAENGLMALAPQPTEPAGDRDFKQVLEKTAKEQASKENEPKKPNKSKKTAKNAVNPEIIATKKNLQKTEGQTKAQQQKRTEETTGMGQPHPGPAKDEAVVNGVKAKHSAQPKEALTTEAKLAQQPARKKVSAQKAESKQAAKKGAEPVNEPMPRAALKRAQALRAAKLKARQEARSELKAEDQAKSTELRERNAPTKGLPKIFQNLAKSTVGPQKTTENEGKPSSGTTFAVNGEQMGMQSKPTGPEEGARSARVEELRPATSAEMASHAGQGQQESPRDTAKEAKENPPPMLPVAAPATPAATGTGAAQAFAPTAGIITPLMEKIWTAVSTFRARGGDELVVKIQADAKTELQLTLKVGKAGVEIQARMQQGDGQQLAANWSELQSALAERGVSLGSLTRDDSAEPDFAHNFEKNSEKQAENGDLHLGDEEADWSTLGLNANEETEPALAARERALPAHDGWQSWA